MSSKRLLVTTKCAPSYRVAKALGVGGGVVMAKHIGKDFMAALKNIVGSEAMESIGLSVQARGPALQRLIEKIRAMVFNAVRMGSALQL